MACLERCPVSAITLQNDDEGFLFPVVFQEKCIECDECARSCQLFEQFPEKTMQIIYSAEPHEKLWQTLCSSGGVFGVLSHWIMEQDGVVYGAVYDKSKKAVKHDSTKNYAIENILRSKYVQSEENGVYKSIENDLKTGKKVLFCGTPCQVAGLKKYLKLDYQYLYTCDFVCHGVPSPVLLHDWIEQLEKDESYVEQVTFREKDQGWRKLCIKIYFKNDKCLYFPSDKNFYYYYFLNNYSLRYSCYHCAWNTHPVSDLTLADDWKTQKTDSNGVSLVMENTERGKYMLSTIAGQFDLLVINPGQRNHVSAAHDYNLTRRERFFRTYRKKGLYYMQYHWLPKERIKNCIKMALRRY